MILTRGERERMRARMTTQLSPRQIETLRYVASGQTDEQIGMLMHVSEMTAKRHVRDILCKFNARNRAHAVHLAHQQGILK